MPPERRSDDGRIMVLQDQVSSLKAEVKELELLKKEMAELKASMKTASWLTTFFGAVILSIIGWVTTHTTILSKVFGDGK